ncbi:MAG: RNA-binding cell elongation regulator Jag/EloR [Coriobacteriia bacterium]|nr:RNA-binding cell elongation regulator Jag/EloR [Coriobacteriia bacterium]
MKRETTAEAGSVADALDIALGELGVQQDAVDYEVFEEGGKRLFGLGAERPAKVKVWLKAAFVAEVSEAQPEKDEEMPEVQKATDSPGLYSDDEVELTEEQLDKIADEAVSAIQSVLQGFDITAQIDEYEGDEGEIILDVVGEDLGVLIGRHGKTLDSIQTLVGAIAHRRSGTRYPVLVDVEGYRNRRRVKLEEIGRRAADRVARQHAPVKLRPMSSYERKVVHVCLRDDLRVKTESEGDEPYRQVVILPK